jgi:hypothetical protein
MEVMRSSETLVTTHKATRRHNPEDHDRHRLRAFENRAEKNISFSESGIKRRTEEIAQ